MKTTDSKLCAPAPTNHWRAFTLTELLVILAILTLLVSLRIPAIAKATGRTKRAICAANLRQFALALQIYGSEYNDRLPPASFGGSWLWDLPSNTGDVLTRFGAGWKVMYCPGTSPRFSDADNFRLYNYTTYYRVLGYALTLSGNATLNPTNANPTLTPQAIPMVSGYLPPPRPSNRVLISDANLTQAGQNDPTLKSTYNWTSIKGGFYVVHLSPHVAGLLPEGCNVAMLDGHVEWRTLDKFLPRTTGGGVPVFWW